MVAGRRGFTLIEAVVALVLSSVLVVLVGTTFLVQNRYYASQTLRAGAHDNARAATERLASELRSTMQDAFVVAGSRTLTFRSPIVLALVCDRQANDVHVHIEGGEPGLDTDEVAGVALRDTLTGSWTYAAATWASIDGGGSPAQDCRAQGADTTGATPEFHTLRQLQAHFGGTPEEGRMLMLFRETTFKIRASVLEPTTLGLFRQVYGGSEVEFATGMDSTAQFQYRTGGTTYADTVVAADLGDIDAVRIVADARKLARSGGQQDVTFGWSVNVSLRNVP